MAKGFGFGRQSEAKPINIHLFTDGGCVGNPGPGGWAYILRHIPTGVEKKASGGSAKATNNQMELQAAIEGLRALKEPCGVLLVADSQYLGKGLTLWMPKWKSRGWRRKGGDPKNLNLWKELDKLSAPHSISFEWVQGHSGHFENELCDQMARDHYNK